MKRILAVGVGVLGCSMLLMACSDNNSSSKGSSSATGAAPTSVSVASSGKTSVKVEGNDLQGLDLNSVTCVKQGGTINIASGAVGGQQGLGVVMKDGQPPTVQSLGMVVDGNALAVSDNMGMKTGSADVKVDGDTYTITGEAAGADMKNPMAGMVSKKFEISVTCK
ncbi:lipoprotein LpqH [Mycolicibacterium psychrotolerans]|uniref:lipoprotein LpqH n=1 Tax=Mycolicibacterium psychrotolerans TaxID=216929 RepID=UPI003D677A29